MRRWIRTPRERRCGRCRRTIYRGQPLLLLVIPAITDPKVRCLDCAGEPVPTDLPPLVVPMATIRPLVHVASGAGRLPLDWKLSAAGAREPGEEG